VTMFGTYKAIVVFCFFTLPVIAGGNVYLVDTTSPSVIDTDPEHLSNDVFPMRHVHFWLCDRAPHSSGVDFDSVTLSLNSMLAPVKVNDLGGSRVWVHTRQIQFFPENSMIEAVINARDNSGNRMEPYKFHFFTAFYPDLHEPVFSNFFPQNNSTDNLPLSLIYCNVTDSGTGVDLESVTFMVDNDHVNFTYAVLEDGFQLFCFPHQQFPPETWVDVYVSAKDFYGNFADIEWSFKTAPNPPHPPTLFYPTNGSLLNYQRENGSVRFMWSAGEPDQYFRIRLKPEGSLVSDVIDLAPSEYWSAANMVGFNHSISPGLWYQYSCREFVQWSVAVIDPQTGNEISNYSNWSSVVFAPPDAVVLRTPSEGCVFSYDENSPLFTWDSYDGAQNYFFGIARISFSTGTLENVFSTQMNASFNNFRLPWDVWNSIGTGNFIWAVLAVKQDGTFSDFMNYTFSKSVPPIMSPPLDFEMIN
jgi:hypothetical protein